ncbi:MAG: M67 family metallopeptidase [Nitrospirota bacterium]
MTMLNIARGLIDRIIAHCRAAYPNEACGIIAGKDQLVEKAYEMTNIDNSNVTYMMDPGEQFRVMKEIRNEGKKMVAIYHSHPHSLPYPSARDVNLAFYSDVVYVIVGLADKDRPEIRAFEIIEGNVEEIKIEVKNE